MSERLGALRSKLPPEVLGIIRSFDSHPTADLIREIEFERFPGHTYAAASMCLGNCRIWAPLAREMARRHSSNGTLYSRKSGVWLPVLVLDAEVWTMSFPRWRFETLEDLDYLPSWVKEEYKLEVRSKPWSAEHFFLWPNKTHHASTRDDESQLGRGCLDRQGSESSSSDIQRRHIEMDSRPPPNSLPTEGLQ